MHPERPLVVDLLFDAFHWFHEGMLATLPETAWGHLTPSQCLLLSRIDEDGTRTAELARRMYVSRQAAHQQVHGLLEAGMVELRPDPDSRSAKRVLLTSAGKDAANVLLAVSQGLEEELSDRIGDRAISDLVGALERDRGRPYRPDRALPADPSPPTPRRSAARRRSRSWP